MTHNHVHVWLPILLYATDKRASHGTSAEYSTAAATDSLPFSSACDNQASDRNIAYQDQLQKPFSLCKDRHMKCSSVLRTVYNTWKVRSSIHAHVYRGSRPHLWSSCKTCIAAAPWPSPQRLCTACILGGAWIRTPRPHLWSSCKICTSAAMRAHFVFSHAWRDLS